MRFLIALCALLVLQSADARMRGGVSAPITSGTYSGAISISGAEWVNGNSQPIQLRGVNLSGLEYSSVQGGQPWYGDPPNWTTLATWKPNIVRIPLNGCSFLGLTAYAITGTGGSAAWGSSVNCDPFGNYRAAIVTQIQNARANNCYILFDLHWTAPQVAIGGVTHNIAPVSQMPAIDANMGATFWTDSSLSFPVWLATNFGSAAFNTAHGFNGGAAGVDYNASYGGSSGFGDIIFELANEPFANNGQSGTVGGTTDANTLLLTGGTLSEFNANYAYTVNVSWTVEGYQAVINAIRGFGMTNAIVVSGNQWEQQLKEYTEYLPTDSTHQIAFGWHPYPDGTYPYSNGNVYPLVGGDGGDGTAASMQWAQGVLTAGYPVVITEDGGLSGTSATATPAEPHVAYMESWVDSYKVAYIPWNWTVTIAYGTASSDNSLTAFASNGTTILPALGEGTQVYNWMVAHP